MSKLKMKTETMKELTCKTIGTADVHEVVSELQFHCAVTIITIHQYNYVYAKAISYRGVAIKPKCRVYFCLS